MPVYASASVGIVEALADPGFYPHRPEAVEVVETHASWVFRAGDLVYKVKKPVVFPFLDYGTLERRRLMCEEEVRLGRRLAPRLYLGVRPIVRRGDGLELGRPGDPTVVEHAVEMRRFRDERTLASMLGRGEDASGAVEEVARRLARFHAQADAAPGAFSSAAVAATVGENFATLLGLAPAAGRTAPAAGTALAAAHRFAVAFVHARRDLIDRRSRHGRAREGHGDLRAEHVILEDGIEIFDPVEFDPGLRRIDVAADLAFLVMDLTAAGRDDLARRLVEAYRHAGGDCGDDGLVAFYAAYRAWVRAKVALLRAGELPAGDPGREAALAEAARLAAVGRRLAWRARGPSLLVVCGGAATGKTTLARAVADVSGLPHLSSDVTRKALAGLAPEQRAPDGLYAEEMSLRTYAELGARAAALASGDGAIVDATFRRRAHRDAFAEAVSASRAEPLYVECRAPASVAFERAALRLRAGTGVSDAGPELAARQRHELDPLDEVRAERHLSIRTDQPLAAQLDELEAALDHRIARDA